MYLNSYDDDDDNMGLIPLAAGAVSVVKTLMPNAFTVPNSVDSFLRGLGIGGGGPKVTANVAGQTVLKWFRWFLDREPDAGGLQHWMRQVMSDGPAAAWANFKRSPEAVQKGRAPLVGVDDAIALPNNFIFSPPGQGVRGSLDYGDMPAPVASAVTPNAPTVQLPSSIVPLPSPTGPVLVARDMIDRANALAKSALTATQSVGGLPVFGVPGAFPITSDDRNGTGLNDDSGKPTPEATAAARAASKVAPSVNFSSLGSNGPISPLMLALAGTAAVGLLAYTLSNRK